MGIVKWGAKSSSVYRWIEESKWAAAYLSWTVEPQQTKRHMEQVHDLYSSAYNMSSDNSGRPVESGYSSILKNTTYLHNFIWLTE